MTSRSQYPGSSGSLPSSGSSGHQSKRAERWERQAAALRANLRRRKGIRPATVDQNSPAGGNDGQDKTQPPPDDGSL